MEAAKLVPRVTREFDGLRLGDRRLERRVRSTVEALARDPAASILAAARSTAEAEAMYRLLRNRRVSMASILAPHIQRAAERCAAVSKVLVLHDTSEFEYRGEDRTGLGRLRTKSQHGFLFHASFGVAAATREPLGLLASMVWVRGDETRNRVRTKKSGTRKTSGSDYAKLGEKESDRWEQQIQLTDERLSGHPHVVHVADREADIYSLLASLRARDDGFVIRLARNRRVRASDSADPEDIVELAARTEGSFQLEVPINARPRSAIPARQKTFGPRDARAALLEFAAFRAEILPPSYAGRAAAAVPVNVVHVRELDAPADQQPVEWLLLTSEPVDTDDAIRDVVSNYQCRWLIEEFFKALKTGCGMEDRELESLHTLTNALALCIPIAHQLLAVRHMAHAEPASPATRVLTEAQIAVLQAKARLPPNPTAHDALVAIAYLGSHFIPFERKKPGWRVLARGMERLFALVDGWSVRNGQEAIKR